MLRFLFILVFVLNFHGVYQADPDVCDPAADYLTLAKQDIENKTYDSALEKLACAEQYEPSNPEIFFNRGVVYFHLKQFPEAIQDYTRAIENSPNIEAPFYLRSLYLRGVLHRDLSDNEAALSDLNACLEAASQITDPDLYGGEIGLAELYIDRGGIYERLHDLEQALADFNYALQLDITHPMVEAAAYAGRGFVYDQLGKVSEAQADWNQAKQFNPRIADYIRVTGITAIDIGNNELAIDIFNRVMRLRDEPDGNDYLFRGQAYTNLEQYSEAIADFTTVLEINPYIYAALFFRGKAYLGAEMYQEAIDDFTAYRKRNLIWPGTLFYRGEAYLGLGDLENAVKDYCAYRVQREPDEALLKLIDERMETIGIARCEG